MQSVSDKEFTQTRNVLTHFRATGYKLYQCNKPYQCNQCVNDFEQNDSFITHLRRHIEDKPYQCSNYAKSFFQKSHLTIHMRTHTLDKPYSCNLCNKSFKYKSNLKKTYEDTHQR